MIDSIGTSVPVQAATATQASPTIVPGAEAGWRNLGLGGTTDGLPTVGNGRDLNWARSWSQLSNRLQSVGSPQDIDRIFNRAFDPMDGRAMMSQYRDVVLLSKQMHEATVQLQMLVQLLQTTSGAADRLLKQQ